MKFNKISVDLSTLTIVLIFLRKDIVFWKDLGELYANLCSYWDDVET